MAALKHSNLLSPSDYKIKRRIQEINAPCRWLHHCFSGKCPAFIREGGNYYCTKNKFPL